MTVKTIILAAGQGTRMRSTVPKVLHRIGGKPILKHVYDMAFELPNKEITIVYGFGGDGIRAALSEIKVNWVEQSRQLGTGHAVMQAVPFLGDEETVLILYGDVPLLEKETIERLLALSGPHKLALLTVELNNPRGYGRIIRDPTGKVVEIVEEKDADDIQKRIKEVNTGIMAVNAGNLKRWLSKLDNRNAQEEYYLTDVIALAVKDGVAVKTTQPDTKEEVLGVNDKQQLAYLERIFQKNCAARLMEQGVTLADPSRFDLRGKILQTGEDVEIDINVVMEGTIYLGNRIRIGANTLIKDSRIEDDVEILPNCVIENADIGPKSRIGPFARLRPGVRLKENVRVGNFVEIKKSRVGKGSKINHLSYIGDSLIGSDVNIGAGTITCNYDGANKFETIIEDGAFIGSDTQLVAPVTVARNATIGAGSTITKSAPSDTLTLSRAKQVSLDSWQRPQKKRG